MDNDTNPLHVGQLSGHKNLDSLRSYHTALLKRQKDIVGDSSKQYLVLFLLNLHLIPL